jgi:hypothetical protein
MAKQTQDFIEASGMDQVPHPPYSPDLAPSDFYLFGYLKQRLQEQHFEDGDQLFDAIMALTGNIEKVTLQKVFLEWMERLRRCIDINGEYVGGPNSIVKKRECFIQCVSRYPQPVGHPISFIRAMLFLKLSNGDTALPEKVSPALQSIHQDDFLQMVPNTI